MNVTGSGCDRFENPREGNALAGLKPRRARPFITADWTGPRAPRQEGPCEPVGEVPQHVRKGDKRGITRALRVRGPRARLEAYELRGRIRLR